MKRALLVVLLGIVGCNQDRVGYIDVQRAVNECVDGKRAIAAMQAAEQARRQVKAPELSDEQWTKQQQAKQREGQQQIVTLMRGILPEMLKARRLSALRSMDGMVAVEPSLDFTDELIRRYDAIAGGDKAAELAAAKAKV